MKTAHHNYYRFKIRLKDAPLPIWRRFIARADVPLSFFHEIAQVIMGWDERLEYRFFIGKRRYTEYDQSWKPSKGEMDAASYTLFELMANPGQGFVYRYGPWVHYIEFEGKDPSGAMDGGPHAYCFSGKRACPPECLSGVEEYAEFVDALEDQIYPEREEIIGKVNWEFDPQAFDARQVNCRLIRLTAELEQVEKDLIARRKKNKLVVLRPEKNVT